VESKNSPDALLSNLAAHLAKPFLLPGQSGQPLSLRCLPDGGMVVIAPDGRKLWFTAREVGTARQQLNLPAVKTKNSTPDGSFPYLHDIHPRRLNFTPSGGLNTRDGTSELISLPADLKHLEKKIHERSGKPQKPRKANPG